MTITELKTCGKRYFDKDSIRLWGSKIESAPNSENIFIESIDSFDRKHRIYKVAVVTADRDIESLMEIDDETFWDSLHTAQKYRKDITAKIRDIKQRSQQSVTEIRLISCENNTVELSVSLSDGSSEKMVVKYERVD